MVNNHGFLTKNHQKTTKKPKNPIKTNDLQFFLDQQNALLAAGLWRPAGTVNVEDQRDLGNTKEQQDKAMR